MNKKDKITTDAAVQPTVETTPESTSTPVTEASVAPAADNKTEKAAAPVSESATATSTVQSESAVKQTKSNKKPWIIVLAVVLLAAVAVVAYMMSNVSKADYKEALANIDEGEKSLTKQFDKALNTVKAGPNRSTDKDRKELEELMKKNQQAMEEVAKSKAFSKDPELKKKFDELREKQKNVDDYTVVSIETIFDVAPLRHNFRNISRHASNQAKADYVRGTVEKMKKIDAKADFNKEFIKSMLEIYEGALEKITKAHADGSTLNLNSYAVKATRALLKWINAVSNQMKKQNPIKGGFEPIKNYLKSKAE